jgi:hypothetical protein
MAEVLYRRESPMATAGTAMPRDPLRRRLDEPLDAQPSAKRQRPAPPPPTSKRKADSENAHVGKAPRLVPDEVTRKPFAPIDTNSRRLGLDDTSCTFGKPITPLDHREAFASLARFGTAAYRNYAREERNLARTRDQIYADSKSAAKGLSGDARYERIKADLDGFEDKPIQLQRLMHFAAFEVEGPLIWGEEYAGLMRIKTNHSCSQVLCERQADHRQRGMEAPHLYPVYPHTTKDGKDVRVGFFRWSHSPSQLLPGTARGDSCHEPKYLRLSYSMY